MGSRQTRTKISSSQAPSKPQTTAQCPSSNRQTNRTVWMTPSKMVRGTVTTTQRKRLRWSHKPRWDRTQRSLWRALAWLGWLRARHSGSSPCSTSSTRMRKACSRPTMTFRSRRWWMDWLHQLRTMLSLAAMGRPIRTSRTSSALLRLRMESLREVWTISTRTKTH